MRAAALSTLVLVLPFALSPTTADPAPAVPIAAAGFSFVSPATVVPPGTAVEFTALSLPHTVTTSNTTDDARDGVANDPRNNDTHPDTFNRNLPQGASFTHTFAKEGVYWFHCQLHRSFGMIGAVVVLDPKSLP